MQIGYQTTDDVHWSIAEGLARDCGARLRRIAPAVDASVHAFDALIVDLDYLASEARERIVSELMRRPPLALVAVHSYGLTDEQIEAMRNNGVIVSRVIGHDLVIKLALAAGFGRVVASELSPTRRQTAGRPPRHADSAVIADRPSRDRTSAPAGRKAPLVKAT